MPLEPSARHFRVHERRAIRLPVVLTHVASGWRCEARTLNVGLGGACLELPQPLEVGDRVRLDVTAPNRWDPLHLAARAVWAQRTQSIPPPPRALGRARGEASPVVRAGIAFEHADPAAVLALFQLIADTDA